MNNTIKLEKMDCGKHYGKQKGPCSKCRMLSKQRSENRQAYQNNGTPWIEVLGPEVPKPEWW